MPDPDTSQEEESVDLEAGVIPEPQVREDEQHEEKTNPDVVWWDGPNDPQNPRNWKTSKKLLNISLVSLQCLITPIASAMFAPGVPKLMEEFHSTNKELASFVVSIFVLGFGVGPMFLAPLSEIYGRLIIYHICNVLFVIFTVACAVSTNLNMLVGFRFLAGIAGSAPVSNGGGTIADLIQQDKRGAAMAAFGIGPMLGMPCISPNPVYFLVQSNSSSPSSEPRYIQSLSS
jgi:MFS family permease